MRIKMLKSTIVDLKQVQEGDFVETDQRSALLLIGIGKAMPAPLPQEVVIEAEEKPQPVKPAPKRRKTNDSQPRV
jgi:cell division protein FtsX